MRFEIQHFIVDEEPTTYSNNVPRKTKIRTVERQIPSYNVTGQLNL